MTVTGRRIGVGVLVVLAALVASLVTMATGGAASTGTSTKVVTETNVAVHLKGGSTKTFSNVASVRLYAGAKKFRLTTRSGATHTWGKSFGSFSESYSQKTVTIPGSTTSPTPTPTVSPTVTPTVTPTITPTVTPTITPTTSPCIGSLCLP